MVSLSTHAPSYRHARTEARDRLELATDQRFRTCVGWCSFSDLYVLDTRGGLLTAANNWTQVKYGADALVPPKRSAFQWALDGDSVLLFGGYCKVSSDAHKASRLR